MATDRWLGVTLEARQLSRHRQMERHPLDARREGESLLLAGSQRGYLVLMDEMNGSVRFSVRGHKSAVNIIVCNPKKNQVISASDGEFFKMYCDVMHELNLNRETHYPPHLKTKIIRDCTKHVCMQ